jgi:hypothetical protein
MNLHVDDIDHNDGRAVVMPCGGTQAMSYSSVYSCPLMPALITGALLLTDYIGAENTLRMVFGLSSRTNSYYPNLSNMSVNSKSNSSVSSGTIDHEIRTGWFEWHAQEPDVHVTHWE